MLDMSASSELIKMFNKPKHKVEVINKQLRAISYNFDDFRAEFKNVDDNTPAIFKLLNE